MKVHPQGIVRTYVSFWPVSRVKQKRQRPHVCDPIGFRPAGRGAAEATLII